MALLKPPHHVVLYRLADAVDKVELCEVTKPNDSTLVFQTARARAFAKLMIALVQERRAREDMKIKQKMLHAAIERLSGLGEGRECPLCGWTGIQFSPRLSRRKPSGDARCPNCKSYERHRFLYLLLRERLGNSRNILHFAPEPSLVPVLKERAASYRSCDIVPGRAMDQEDITKLSYSDEQFDFIMCNQVLEHIPDDKAAMNELHRVLSPSGICVVSVPLWRMDETYEDPSIVEPKDRERAFGQIDHVRLYGMKDFVKRLEQAGFETEMITPRHYDPYEVGRYGLNHLTSVEIFFCTKSN